MYVLHWLRFYSPLIVFWSMEGSLSLMDKGEISDSKI